METMRAIICPKYGPPEVLQHKVLAKPSPKDNEVRIKIHTTTVHIGDTKIRAFRPGLGFAKDLFFKPIMRLIIGFTGPRKPILGMELAGVIEAVGGKVTQWKPGDQVFAATGMHFGAYAEYVCLPANGLIVPKPANLSFEEAAPLPNGAITALLILRKAHITSGQKVLIYGASGSVGTFAVQLAKQMGAEVTAVCSSANLAMVKSLGADAVIDYTVTDFTNADQSYDVIFDAVGKLSSAHRKKSLTKNGMYLNFLTGSDGLKLKNVDLVAIKELAETGKLRTVIDRQYPMEEIVEAHRYVEQGHKKGNVVIAVIPPITKA